MSGKEIERREAFGPDSENSWVYLTCDGCGKTVTLFFNGGELDQHSCATRRYALEHARIDLVKYER